jgi:FkbM family methyltransferase
VLRSWAEKLSRGVVLKRHLPQEFHSRPIFVSPDSALRFWRHDLTAVDPVLLRSASDLVSPGDIVWDIGANVGLFSFAASVRAGAQGRVLAVEPDPWLSDLPRRSARLRGINEAPVHVLPVAVSDSLSVANLNIAARGRSANFISGFGTTQTGGKRDSFSVMSVTLDWLLKFFPAPTLLKIDVEAMEGAVLRGASEILKMLPKIIIEVARESFSEVSSMLSDYKLLDCHLRTPAHNESCNIVAFPKTN